MVSHAGVEDLLHHLLSQSRVGLYFKAFYR